MPRNRFRFSEKPYDVLVVGGGIYGAWIAWDAVLRGLSVALVEKGDFGHATTSNSSRIIHGGLRYLQHGDLRRTRQSTYERTVLMRLAPHLVRPLPFLIPTYGHELRSKWILRLALMVNDLIGADRTWRELHDPATAMPPGRGISRDECCRLAPGVTREGLTGGVIYYEAQVPNSERLLLSVMRSAFQKGIDAANYLEAVKLLRRSDHIIGVIARDVFTGDELEIQGRIVVNATGPWIDHLLGRMDGYRTTRRRVFSKAFDLVVDRQVNPDCAVGFYSPKAFRDPDVLLSKGARLLFIIPWHGRSLLGTAYLPSNDDPDNLKVTEEEIHTFLQEINGGYSALRLTRQEIRAVFRGLVPAAESRGDHVRLLKRPQILDLSTEPGLAGLICVTGVKFTEARCVAEQVVDLVFRRLGKVPPKSATATTPLHGGCLGRLDDFVAGETRNPPPGIPPEVVRRLINQYGSAYGEVLMYLDDPPEAGGAGAESRRVLRAQVRYGIRQEMAQKLVDVVFRRTTLGMGHVGDEELQTCADVMADELGWSQARKQEEIEGVKSALPSRV